MQNQGSEGNVFKLGDFKVTEIHISSRDQYETADGARMDKELFGHMQQN
jgi:hypothetical protein